MTEPPGSTPSNPSTNWRLVAVLVVVVIAVVAGFALLRGDDDDGSTTSSTDVSGPDSAQVTDTAGATTSPSDGTQTTTVATIAATTELAPTTVDTIAPPFPDATADAIWPWVDSSTRYDDPIVAATGFAVEYLEFTDPIVGAFLAGDARSGEVEIRSSDTGPVTTILVRQLSADDSWWVLGAVSENITVDQPATRTEISSPVEISGAALAFEGTVDVELRVDGATEPILVGFVTGSGGPEPGPFSETFEFASPGATSGALVMSSRSSEDGTVVEAVALRVVYR